MLKKSIKSIAPLPLLEKVMGRSRQVFALGTPKSGTTSIAGMFAERCRVDHEPHRPTTVNTMHQHYLGELTDDELKDSYRARDKQLLLDLESNCFMAYRPDLLLETFPDAKFIVTVREPLAWLNSILDNNLNFPKQNTATMTQWHEVLFQEHRFAESRHEPALAERGLYPLDAYLSYWSRTYSACLRSLANAQLLVIGTNQISDNTDGIGEFVGVSLSNVPSKRTHKNQTSEKHGILQMLDGEHVAESIDKNCQAVVSEYGLAELWS